MVSFFQKSLLFRYSFTAFRGHPVGKTNVLSQPLFRNDISAARIRGFRKTRLPSGEDARQALRMTPVEAAECATEGPVPANRLLKATCFTAAVCGGCFVGCAVLQYENHRRKSGLDLLRERFEDYGFTRPRKAGSWRARLNTWWDGLSPGEKVFAPICLANILVWAAWRVPAWKGFMVRYFTSSPGSASVVAPMLFSTFSHHSFLHLFVNMYVLHSFTNAIVHSMGKEQFLGFYVSAGVFASLVSYAYKIAFSVPGLSLGASGAIMGVVGYVCSVFPDIQLAIIFLPMYSFSAENALRAVLLMDTCGCVFKWSVFDHAAHLGGAFFGILYAYFSAPIWRQREKLIHSWHSFRVGMGRHEP